MRQDLNRKQRAEMSKLHELAWRRELGRELSKLYETFQSWRDGEFDAFDLTDSIHRFHDGESRKLYGFYANDSSSHAVPSAIARGIISESAVSSELLQAIHHDIQRFQELYGG